MDLKAFDNIYIWGTAFRGGQIYNELTNQNIKVTAFIDSYKRNEEIDGIAVLFPAQVLCDENVNAVIIIASLKYESNEQIKGAITNSKYRGKFFTNYEYYMNYERNFLLKESQEEVLLEDSFDKKIANWFDTFLSEVDFWRNQVANPKGEWNWCYRGKFQKKQFSCERLPFKINGDETILDVGCGICSPYGKYLDEKKINLVQVDPLAEFYNQINSRFVIAEKEDEEVDLVHFGMFEFLTYQFGCEYADVILIDNALDHCIDPYCALCECISTVKKGGTVSLKHHENEAFRENYANHHNIPIEQAPKTMTSRVSEQEHFDIKDDKIILSNGDIYNIDEIICQLHRIEILDKRFFKVGLGSCLLKALESIAIKNNCSQIEAFFSPFGDFSHGALSFYKNNGFEFYKHPRFNTDYIRKYLSNCKTTNNTI